MALTDQDKAILDLERGWWAEPGTKAEVIRRRLGLSPSHYRRLLAGLVDRDDALHHDPLLVRRLRRMRDERRRSRYEGRRARQGR